MYVFGLGNFVRFYTNLLDKILNEDAICTNTKRSLEYYIF